MKKLLFTLVLLFSLHSFGQNSSFSNPVAEANIFLSNDYFTFDNAFVVPDNQYMIVANMGGNWVFATEEEQTDGNYGYGGINYVYTGYVLPAGTLFWSTNSQSPGEVV